MKQLIGLIVFLSSAYGNAQSLSDANFWFNKYEYQKSAELFELISKNQKLSKEDYQKMVYAYYIVGDYKKCKPMIDSLVQLESTPAFFHFVQGKVNLSLSNFKVAKGAFEKYATLDNEEDVTLLIQACDSIPSWNQQAYYKLDLFALNDSKSDVSGFSSSGRTIIYKESGKDSSGVAISDGISNSEYFTSRPYLVSATETSRLKFIDSLDLANITSLTFLPNSTKLFVSFNEPLAEKLEKQVPHIYTATLNELDSTIQNVVPWKYGGFEDTTSCGHITINESGTLLVFSKMGSRTKNADLYLSSNENGTWTMPREITTLNTNLNEMYPLFSGDSLLIFSSDGMLGYGELDIYSSKILNGKFQKPVHFKAPINSSSDDFGLNYITADSSFFSSNRFGGIGDDDIYSVVWNAPKPIIPVEPIDTFEEQWEPPLIYFDFDKFNLKKDVYKLDELMVYLEKNPQAKILIEGHADKRGSENYNLWLGMKRAKSVQRELIELGINESQIDVASKGKSNPQVNCDGCSEEEHAKNRVAIIYLDSNK